MHRSTPLNYYPTSLFRGDVHAQRTKALAEKMEKRQREMAAKSLKLQQTASAAVIQRGWRYYYANKIYRQKRKAVAQIRHERWKQRKKDDVRQLYSYILYCSVN